MHPPNPPCANNILSHIDPPKNLNRAPKQERERRVEEVAALLGLTSVLESKVGGALDRGISGGYVFCCLVGGWILMRVPCVSFIHQHLSKSPVDHLPTIHQPGGQLKRLSVGVEIINPPRLLFLDEPTSGALMGMKEGKAGLPL